jgi:hypothetical protein
MVDQRPVLDNSEMAINRLIGLARALLLPIAACDPAPEKGPTTRPATPSATVTPPLPTAEQLAGALLSRSAFPGYRRFGPSSGLFAPSMGRKLANAVGVLEPAPACGALDQVTQINLAKPGERPQPPAYATVTYARGSLPASRVTFESLMAVTADYPAGKTEIRVPPHCKRYATGFKGQRTTVTVRTSKADDLPRLGEANVTGIDATLTLAGAAPVRIHTLSIRSGPLLMLISMNGDRKADAKVAAKAWQRARDRLGLS